MNSKFGAENLSDFGAIRELPSISLISGSEFLLNQENLDALRKRANAEGFLEKKRIDAADRANLAATDWRNLQLEYETPSLFASKRLIEFHGGQKTLDKHATAVLENIAQIKSPEIILIIYLPNLEKEAKIKGILELRSSPLNHQQYEAQIKKQ